MEPLIPPTGPGTGAVSIALEQAELAALAKVVFHYFNAQPASVSILKTTTFSWSTTIPTGLGFPIAIQLSGVDVPATGTKVSETLRRAAAYTLSARTGTVSRQLGEVTVQVTTSDCQSKTIDPLLITTELRTQFNDRFSGSSKFTLNGNGTTVTLGNDTINMAVSLTLNVPDWFDADMEIAIQLALSPGASVVIAAPTVTANISWSFFENLLSLGCGDAIQSGMTQIAQAFLADIVSAEIIPPIASFITGQVNTFIQAQDQANPGKTFVMTNISLNSGGLTFQVCPR